MPFASIPGGNIAYDDYYFGRPWLAPETVVLVHGFSKNRKFWYEWIPALASRYRVLCLDHRGHGESSPLPPDFKMDLKLFADDMAAFLDAVGLASAHFVMAEFSSTVAVEFAVSHPDRIRCLVLPGFGYNLRANAVDTDETMRLLRDEGTLGWARATNHHRLPAGTDPKLCEWYISQQAKMPAWFLMKALSYAPSVDLTDKLPLIQAPTLMLGGSEARQGLAEHLRRASELIPRSKLVIFEGMPFNVMTACAQACVDATLEFLEAERQKP